MSLGQNKVTGLLGLAMKARGLASGEYQTLTAVRSGKAGVVIIAQDASDNTKKLFHDKCSFYKVPVYEYGTKEDLGQAIGKDLRSSLAVCDTGLATAVIRQLETK